MEDDKIFDFRYSSYTFNKLMKKYNKRKNKPIFTNKGYFLNAIEEKREKLQFEEKDDKYIYKETKNIANMNNLLLNLYGNKAKKRYYNVSKLLSPIKIEKKLFFTSDKNEEKSKDNKINLTDKFINKKGIMKLPLIFEDFILNKKKEKESKSTKNFFTIDNNKNSDIKKFIKKFGNKNEKIKTGIDVLQLTIKDKIKNKNKNKKNMPRNIENNILPYSSSSTSKCNKNILILTQGSQRPKNIIIKEYKNKENKVNKLNKQENNNKNEIKRIKNEFTLSDNYISQLTIFKDQFIKEEKKNRKYFNKNDYGCESFKEKYNFLNTKYFN